MVFQPHLSRILYLRRTATKELASRSRRHRTSHSDFTLATDIGTADRSILLDDVSYQAGCSQGTKNALLTHVMGSVHVVKHGGQDTTSSTGRSCHDDTTRGVLLADRQSIGIHQATTLQGGTISLRLGIVSSRLARQLQRSRQHTLMIQTMMDGLFHGLPNHIQVIPDFLSLAFLNILPEGTAIVITPLLNISQLVQVIYILGAQLVLLTLTLGKCATAYAIDRPLVQNVAIHILGDKLHSVGMERKKDLWLPVNLDRMMRL